MHVGIVGAGTMGSNIARNLAQKGHKVHVYSRSSDRCKLLKDVGGVKCYDAPQKMMRSMSVNNDSHRVIMSMLPHGKAFDDFYQNVLSHVDEGDIFIDGANEHYETANKRGKRMRANGHMYLGAGVSGGAAGALNGPCVMMSGSVEAYDRCSGLFTSMCLPAGNFSYFGTDYGAGHFVKTVHNGIEYAMLQVVSELYDYYGKKFMLLSLDAMQQYHPAYGYIAQITKNIIKSVDVENIKDTSAMNSTGLWCSQYAVEHGIAVPTITSAVHSRILCNNRLFPHRIHSANPYREDERIYKTLQFVFGCALHDGKVLCDHYGVDFGLVAKTWSKGSIVECNMLTHDIPSHIHDGYSSAKGFAFRCNQAHVPCATVSAALEWYKTSSALRLPMNLVMAQRNTFGNHKYETRDAQV